MSPENQIESTFLVESNEEAASIFGERDANLRLLEEETGAEIFARGNEVHLRGTADQVQRARQLLEELTRLARQGHGVDREEVAFASRLVGAGGGGTGEAELATVLVSDRGKAVRPRTEMQRQYLAAIAEHDLVFAIGPAGTGKTYLAMAAAVAALRRKEVSRLILTRPALEAGERLGFLPGDIQAKVDPYLRPLFDALYDMMDLEKARRLVERGVIEVAPLAFMRGRTLNDSFIILDEAQNTSREQMKMFLTRLGFSSRAVVTGDVTQTDLPAGQTPGLEHVRQLLRGTAGIAFVYFSDQDVVRHELVQRIIQAYEREEGAARRGRER